MIDPSLVANSNLTRRLLQPPKPKPLPTPPLPLSTGHTALLVAAGQLNGIVRPKGEPPHVVRGTTSKVERVVDSSVIENDDGSVTTKETRTEIIQLTVRTVDEHGVIHTFTSGGE